MRVAVAPADAATRLLRALRASAALRGVAIEPITIESHPWASATFEGDRHTLRVQLVGANARLWLDLLPEAALPMRGHIVADIAAEAISGDGNAFGTTIAALTLAER